MGKFHNASETHLLRAISEYLVHNQYGLLGFDLK